MFLNDLRNALSHTKGKLIPQFSKENKEQKTKDPKTKLVFKINIPVTRLANGYDQFNPKSKNFKIISIKVAPGKEIKINDALINDLYLLSMHILEITKKQKFNTLLKYLDKIPSADK